MKGKFKSQKGRVAGEIPPKVDPNDFLIVGIGASAGGIQALKHFFENVPADSGAAYVVILHLSPDHDSKLAEVLQTVSAIPVAQVRGKSQSRAESYLRRLAEQKSFDGGRADRRLADSHGRGTPRTIGYFFRTLAESHCARAVAVGLSGTGADGSMGIKARQGKRRRGVRSESA